MGIVKHVPHVVNANVVVASIVVTLYIALLASCLWQKGNECPASLEYAPLLISVHRITLSEKQQGLANKRAPFVAHAVVVAVPFIVSVRWNVKKSRVVLTSQR